MLRVDTRISCLSGEFTALRACAAAMLVVFVVGLPLFWCAALLKQCSRTAHRRPFSAYVSARNG